MEHLYVRPFPTPQWNLAVADPPADAVVLISAGVDSMICADLYPDARLLFVDFGQPESACELRAALRLFGTRGFERARIEARVGASADGVFIPARNLLLASLALHYGSHVVMGGLLDDRAIDKTPTAFRDFSRVLSDYSGRRVVVSSPLFALLKHEAVAAWLARGGSPERLRQTWSCYGPGPERCGSCKACFRWAVALRVNGVMVPMPERRVIERYLGRLHLYDRGRAWAILRALSPDPVMVCGEEGADLAALRAHAASGGWVVLHSARPESERAEVTARLLRRDVPFHALLMDATSATEAR